MITAYFLTLLGIISIALGLVLCLRAYFHSSPNSHDNVFTGALLNRGWGYIIYHPSDGAIITHHGIDALRIDHDASQKLHNIADLGQYFDVKSCDTLADWLHKDDTAAPYIIRLSKRKPLQLYLYDITAQHGSPARLLTVQDIAAEHKQKLTLNAENEVLKSEHHWHSAILNHIPTPVWIRAKDLSVRYCNLPYMQIVEENDSVIGSGSMPELFKDARMLASQACEEKQTQTKRHALVVDGQRRLFEISEIYAPSMESTIGMAQEITALERLEAKLDKQLTTLSDLLDSSSSAMTIYGADGKLQFYNSAYARIWGLDEAWLENEPTFAETLEHLRELRKLPEQVNFPAFKQQRLRIFSEATEPEEELFYLPDGRTLRNVTIPHSAGGILFIYEDVTDRLALERSYNTLIAVQRETLDSLHEGIVVFGEDGKLRLKNPVFMSLWELEEKDLTQGTHISEFLDRTRILYASKDWESFKAGFIAQVQSRSLYNTRIERRDGAVLDCSAVPLPDGGVLLTYIDITATTLVERSLREKNDALEAGDKMKTEFLANMSYELRSPLTSISGFAEMLLGQYVGEFSAQQKDYIEGIYKSSQHLMHLINDILDLSSIEAGYMTLNIREFEICKLLHSMMTLLSERLREFKLTARVECEESIGMMKADETRIRQVLFHLLSNAVKYSHESGEIVLGARQEEESIIIWVQDSGIGISEKEQLAVFDKFYRGDAGTRKSGTGLGLSMVKNFVELHGGQVALDSQEYKGTIVSCILPRHPVKAKKRVVGQVA